jgi:hypothetical protein
MLYQILVPLSVSSTYVCIKMLVYVVHTSTLHLVCLTYDLCMCLLPTQYEQPKNLQMLYKIVQPIPEGKKQINDQYH